MPRITSLGGSSAAGFRPVVDDPAPTYALTVPIAVDRNTSFTVTLNTTNVNNGVQVPYTVSGPTTTSLGVFTVSANTATATLTTTESFVNTTTVPVVLGLRGIPVTATVDCYTSRVIPTVEPSGNISLNWTYYTTSAGTPDSFEIYVDGLLRANVSTSTASFAISSGSDRTLLIRPRRGGAYTGADITRTVRYFEHTGSSQSWTVPAGRQYMIVDVLGAQGGGPGGPGGRTRTFMPVTAGETLYFYVGGAGTTGTTVSCSTSNPGLVAGGFNGGGSGGYVTDTYGCPSGTSYIRGHGGGGASDVRRGGTALANRIIVSGGGGGGNYQGAGLTSASLTGHGAGYLTQATDGGSSGQPYWSPAVRGYAATDTAGGAGGPGAVSSGGSGSLGQGGSATTGGVYGDNPGGSCGGGGGYYGGGAGGANSNYGSAGAGGGGSGYLDPFYAGLFSNYGTSSAGYNTGAGKILVIV